MRLLCICNCVSVAQPVAMVVADTEQGAKDASYAVKVDYEDLPVILTIEVSNPPSPNTHTHTHTHFAFCWAVLSFFSHVVLFPR